MSAINERVSDATIDEILAGCIEGVEPTTHEIAMAIELQQYRAAAEPVAWQWFHLNQWHVTNDEERARELAWDGVKVVPLYRHAAPQVTSVPETLPCPVILEPGIRFGKGVRTQAVLDALQRRATYYAELESMTPEQRDEHDAGIKEFAAMLNAVPAVQAEQHDELPYDPQISEYEKIMQQAIPDGYALVPVEPTKEMIDAGWSYYMTTKSPSSLGIYGAMLTAVPHFREIWNSSTNNCRKNADSSTKCWCHTCRPVTMTDMRFVVCPECGNKRCPHANDHKNACTGSNEPGQEGSAYPAAPQQEDE